MSALVENMAASPQCPADNRSARITSRVLLCLNLAITTYVVVNLTLTQRRYESIFNDFGAELPVLTIVMLSPWAIAVLIVLMLLSLAKECVLKNLEIAVVVNGVHLAISLVVWELHIRAVLLPMIELIELLS
jgi:hypothetical protein